MELRLDDLIVRKFTKDLKEGQTVYDLFEWVKRDVVLKNYKTGDIIVLEKSFAEFLLTIYEKI